MENNKKDKSLFIRNICIGIFLVVLLFVTYFLFGNSIKKYLNINVSTSASIPSVATAPAPVAPAPVAPAPAPVAPAPVPVPVAPTPIAPQTAGTKILKSSFNINNLKNTIEEFQKVLK